MQQAASTLSERHACAFPLREMRKNILSPNHCCAHSGSSGWLCDGRCKLCGYRSLQFVFLTGSHDCYVIIFEDVLSRHYETAERSLKAYALSMAWICVIPHVSSVELILHLLIRSVAKSEVHREKVSYTYLF